jgi:hypothetical protein
VYKPEKKITLTDDLTLYARWIKEKCTVTFDANGGTAGTMDAVTKAGGTEFEIPPCGFSFDGYHPYAGWGTSALGEVVYHPGDKITLTDDLTLYAKWSYPQTEFTLNGLKYESNSQISPTVSLTKYDGSKPTGDLVIPGSVTYGGTGYTVTTISNGAFLGCTGLTSVTIPSSVKTIGQEAFSDCTAMTHLISKATTPPTCGTQALDDINKWNCTLSVPEGCNSVYQQANQWKDFFFIDNDISGINSLAINKNLSVKSRYTLNGQQVSKPQRGLNIIRISNGTTKKIVVK